MHHLPPPQLLDTLNTTACCFFRPCTLPFLGRHLLRSLHTLDTFYHTHICIYHHTPHTATPHYTPHTTYCALPPPILPVACIPAAGCCHLPAYRLPHPHCLCLPTSTIPHTQSPHTAGCSALLPPHTTTMPVPPLVLPTTVILHDCDFYCAATCLLPTIYFGDFPILPHHHTHSYHHTHRTHSATATQDISPYHHSCISF